jgi:HAD superfamily hydrolase (TIGR01509 family)
MPQAVLFDVGDTLILGHPQYWLWPLLQERGIAEQADGSRLREAIGSAYTAYNQRHLEANTIERALPVWRAFHRAMLAGIGLPEYADEIATHLAQNWQNPRSWPLTPGAKEVLAELKRRGYKLGVVSNWDALLPGVLECTGLSPYFDYIGASALEGVAKPDPRIFQIVLDRLGVAPAEAVHVGDSPDDVKGATAAGIHPILFDPYKHNPEALHDLHEVLSRVIGA